MRWVCRAFAASGTPEEALARYEAAGLRIVNLALSSMIFLFTTSPRDLAISATDKLKMPMRATQALFQQHNIATTEIKAQGWRAVAVVYAPATQTNLTISGMHITQAVQTLAGMATGFGKARSTAQRGVYKLGEEVHAKVIVRSDTPAAGMQLLPAGTPIEVVLRDSQNKEVTREKLTLNEWSSAQWVFRVPEDAPLGNYTMEGRTEDQQLAVRGGFLVAAYRRPDFRADVGLDAPSTLAGTNVTGRITGRYLYGGAMAGRDVRWTWSKRPVFQVPAAIRDRWQSDRWVFLGWNEELDQSPVAISSNEEKLGPDGALSLTLPTNKQDGWPYDYRLEAEVTDVTRQRIANRTSFRTDPAAEVTTDHRVPRPPP